MAINQMTINVNQIETNPNRIKKTPIILTDEQQEIKIALVAVQNREKALGDEVKIDEVKEQKHEIVNIKQWNGKACTHKKKLKD